MQTAIMTAAIYATAVFLYLALSANCQPLIEEAEFLKKYPAIDNLHMDIAIENLVLQFSLMKIPESNRTILKPDLNSGSSCKQEKGKDSIAKVNDCNSTVLEYPFRLVGGGSEKEGRLEVYMNGQWGTVCDEGWDMLDARVVCQSLGFIGNTIPLMNATFGEGTGPIWMSSVSCSGREHSIKKCMYEVTHNCSHGNDAGVRCSDDGIRLVNGKSWREGRVEMYKDGEWGTVCDDGWGYYDASVVCRPFGLQGIAVIGAAFGEGKGPILRGNVRCTGTESSLWECQYSNNSKWYCSHADDAGVKCFTDGIRLVNGKSWREGRVEMYKDGEWGTVCDDGWGYYDASVVCRPFGLQGIAVIGAAFGEGKGPILRGNVRCTGTESSLWECQYSNNSKWYCSHADDAGVKCFTDSPIRLVGGKSDTEGRVEVYWNGSWGTICRDSFDTTEAKVLCNYLGYGFRGIAADSNEFGQGTGPVWLSDLRCNGNELSVLQCSQSQVGHSSCPHSRDVGIVCMNATNNLVRLVDGKTERAGRVEVLINGQWDGICDIGWDRTDAKVVCRSLGYHGFYFSTSNNWFGGVKSIWQKYSICNGEELSLLECSHHQFGLTCSRGTAGVICSNETIVRVVNGISGSAGMVEVFLDGQWGYICDEEWDHSDAKVVCRGLGYSGYSMISSYAFPGNNTREIPVTKMACSGNEDSIWRCDFPNIGSVKCPKRNVAGVLCTNESAYQLRLLNGSSENEGRVEIFINKEWGTICGNGIHRDSALVICNNLGYFGFASLAENGVFGESLGRIWMSDVKCDGSEKSLSECGKIYTHQHCSHEDDAGVICHNSTSHDVRLVNGNSTYEGGVEVFLNGRWAAVCDNEWDRLDAKVVCKSLGFKGYSAATSGSVFSEENSTIHVNQITCKGSEESLLGCKHLVTSECGISQMAGVVCVENTTNFLRLVNGSSEHEGRPEIYVNGKWGGICSNKWNPTESYVLCRSLGYIGQKYTSLKKNFGHGTEFLWMHDVSCTGRERHILECDHVINGNQTCRSGGVGLICSNAVFDFIRLVNGESENEGRLEVYYNGEWGTVCDKGWDVEDTKVVCRSLGYTETWTYWGNAHFGQGSGPIAFRNVHCSGTEASLFLCRTGTTVYCYHWNDVGIRCT